MTPISVDQGGPPVHIRTEVVLLDGKWVQNELFCIGISIVPKVSPPAHPLLAIRGPALTERRSPVVLGRCARRCSAVLGYARLCSVMLGCARLCSARPGAPRTAPPPAPAPMSLLRAWSVGVTIERHASHGGSGADHLEDSEPNTNEHKAQKWVQVASENSRKHMLSGSLGTRIIQKK